MDRLIVFLVWATVAIVLLVLKARSRPQTNLLTATYLDKRLSSFLDWQRSLFIAAGFANFPTLFCAFWLLLDWRNVQLLHDGPWAIFSLDLHPLAVCVPLMIVGFICLLLLSLISWFLFLASGLMYFPAYRGFDQFCVMADRELGLNLRQFKGETWEGYVRRVKSRLRHADLKKPLPSMWAHYGKWFVSLWLLLGPALVVLLPVGYCKIGKEGIWVRGSLAISETFYPWEDVEQVDARVKTYTDKHDKKNYSASIRIMTKKNSEFALSSSLGEGDEDWTKAAQTIRDSGIPVHVEALSEKQKRHLPHGVVLFFETLSQGKGRTSVEQWKNPP